MFTQRRIQLALTLLTASLVAPDLSAQWSPVKNDDYGVAYKMPKKDLQVVPGNKARPVAHQLDKWASIKPIYAGDKRYNWDIRVYGFRPKGPTTGGPESVAKTGGEATDKSKKPKFDREAFLRAMGRGSFDDFESWLKKSPSNKSVDIQVAGKKSKQRGGARLAYERWEWTSSSGIWLSIAARYVLDRREVVMVATIPASQRKKLRRTIDRTLETLTLHEADPTDARRKVDGEEFAEVEGDEEFTRLRRRLLDEAVDAVEKLPGWDLFCTKHYIVVYSYDAKKHQKARSFARTLAAKMDEMNAQYRKLFPPHDKMKKWWSVLRICRSKAEFDRYGGTSGGVVGWFNSSSKELVVFNAKKLGLFKTDVVAFHEGWHQYANFWFPGARLHRWFGEGMGDYFGSMKRLGRNTWTTATSKMRKETIQRLVRAERTVPLREIVRWHMAKFYGPRATDYYAQGWAMVDFFQRGKKSPYWKKKWDEILPTYIRVALETKDTEKAVKAAYSGVDWDELEEAFKNYVKRSL